MKYHEDREECLSIFDEENPLESARQLARHVIGAATNVEVQVNNFMEQLREHQRHNKTCFADHADIRRAHRAALRTRKEARNVRRNLRFALEALKRGETSTFVDFMRRRARFSSRDESTLEFRNFVIVEPIEPTEYHELLQQLSRIDAGSGSLH